MTLCTPSPITNPVPACTQYLTLGTVANFSSNLSLYVRDITTDRVYYFAVNSDGTGIVIADFTEFYPMSSHSYEFWITEDGSETGEKIDIVIDGATSNVFALRFRQINDGEDVLGYTNQTLTLA